MNKITVEIKLLASLRGLTLTHVAQKMSERLKKPYSLANLSNKLKRGSISIDEVRLLADILGYNIKFVEKNEKDTIEELL